MNQNSLHQNGVIIKTRDQSEISTDNESLDKDSSTLEGQESSYDSLEIDSGRVSTPKSLLKQVEDDAITSSLSSSLSYYTAMASLENSADLDSDQDIKKVPEQNSESKVASEGMLIKSITSLAVDSDRKGREFLTFNSAEKLKATETLTYGTQLKHSSRRTSKSKQHQILRKTTVSATNLQVSQEIANAAETRKKFTILLIGDAATGKTSLINRFVRNEFSEVAVTIAIDVHTKTIPGPDGEEIDVQLKDLAGQDRYISLTHPVYKNADGAIIVFDVTRNTTFENVVRWKANLNKSVRLPSGRSIPCVLAANKCDIKPFDALASDERMDKFCEYLGVASWFPTSAKTDINITEAVLCLIEKIRENLLDPRNVPRKDPQIVSLSSRPKTDDKGKCYC
ncbi:ras-related protein Rab-32-like [Periplaneta americana]|uniref:ras-related protein Rab-32-like n=1 Tax=Periplaneta americana TaxID=6978 RepID=UPI0037E92231